MGARSFLSAFQYMPFRLDTRRVFQSNIEKNFKSSFFSYLFIMQIWKIA